jgi:hypothetical protein
MVEQVPWWESKFKGELMGDFANITLNGKPLTEFLSDEYRREVEQHFATEEIGLRRAVARGRSMPVPIALQKRGRKPIEVRSWTMAEIKGLAADRRSASVRLQSVPTSPFVSFACA